MNPADSGVVRPPKALKGPGRGVENDTDRPLDQDPTAFSGPRGHIERLRRAVVSAWYLGLRYAGFATETRDFLAPYRAYLDEYGPYAYAWDEGEGG